MSHDALVKQHDFEQFERSREISIQEQSTEIKSTTVISNGMVIQHMVKSNNEIITTMDKNYPTIYPDL